jgi:hypothetical protein
MQEIKLSKNPSGLRVFINGVPRLELIPKAQLDIMVNALEKQISEHFEKKKPKK